MDIAAPGEFRRLSRYGRYSFWGSTCDDPPLGLGIRYVTHMRQLRLASFVTPAHT